MKKFKEFLFAPDNQGITWFEVICTWVLGLGAFVGLIFLMKAAC